MEEAKKPQGDGSDMLTPLLGKILQVPGVRFNREAFLREQFKNASPQDLELIIKEGPEAAGYDRKTLHMMARNRVYKWTMASSGASFLAGLPGGFTMAATIPADMVQFYALALRAAQEVAYIYGEDDLWSDNMPDDEKVTNQLILYCGVMFGVTTASSAIRVLASQLGKATLKRLPQKALTKGVVYPVVKSIARTLSVRMTKSIFSKGVSRVIPVIGGAVSGGITWASMRPMGMRLISVMDQAHFDYSQSDFENDWKKVSDFTSIDTD